MAAGATPTIYDPKTLAQVSNFSTTPNTTVYTAPVGEAGVKVERIVITNKTGSAATCTLKHFDGSIENAVLNAASVPGDGYPVVLELGIYLDASDVIRGNAGTATALDIGVYGIEMKD